MATWTHLVSSTDTSNTTSYATGSFTPTAGSLMGVFVQAMGSVAAAPTLTASANGLTFTRLSTKATKNGAIDTTYFFIANQVTPGSPSAMTLTFTCTSDAATAVVISGGEASGMSRVGTSAVKQIINVDEVASGTAPTTTFAASALTGNVTLFGMASTVGTARTAPTNWTKNGEQFTATPTGGFFYGSRNSGFTGTTITAGSSTNGACGALAVELDTSTTGQSATLGIATETDTPLTMSRAVSLGLPTETDTALAITAVQGSPPGGAGVIAYQATSASTRTATTDPYTFSHTGRADASGGIQGVLVLCLNLTNNAQDTIDCTYDGVTLPLERAAQGSANSWRVYAIGGSALVGHGGTKTVSIDLSSATTNDYWFTVITLTSDNPIDFTGGQEFTVEDTRANPSGTLDAPGPYNYYSFLAYATSAGSYTPPAGWSSVGSGGTPQRNIMLQPGDAVTVGPSSQSISFVQTSAAVCLIAFNCRVAQGTVIEDFESGTHGSDYTTTSGKSSSGATGTQTTVKYDNAANIAGGALGLKSVSSGTDNAWTRSMVFPTAHPTKLFMAGSFKVDAAILNGSAQQFFRVKNSGGSTIAYFGINGSGNVYLAENGTIRILSGAAAVAAGSMYTLEAMMDCGTDICQMKFWDSTGTLIEGTATLNGTFATQAHLGDEMEFGIQARSQANGSTSLFDRIGYSTVDWLGPYVPSVSSIGYVGIPMN